MAFFLQIQGLTCSPAWQTDLFVGEGGSPFIHLSPPFLPSPRPAAVKVERSLLCKQFVLRTSVEEILILDFILLFLFCVPCLEMRKAPTVRCYMNGAKSVVCVLQSVTPPALKPLGHSCALVTRFIHLLGRSHMSVEMT